MEEAENSDNGPISKNDELSNSPAKSCALCGCSTPAVRCDRCSSQIFCLSCDDMYHRHPKRRLHLRKAVDSIWNTARSPRLRRRTDLPGDPSKIPIPPPRSKKRERHTIGGRIFLKPSHELGSFGHSKVFDARTITPPLKDVFAGPKTPAGIEGTYENEPSFPTHDTENNTKGNEIYENENVPVNQTDATDNSSSVVRNPWNVQRTNISSPIQVSIPSSSPDLMTNGQSFGYPMKPQSRSIADLTGPPTNPIGQHPYHLPHYPYMHPSVHPQQYSHSMAHLNCAQCLSSSWSNLMSPHPSPYFHPMPWGSAQGSLVRGQAPPPANGHMRHSHGNLPSYPDPNFHYPYPGAPYYANGAPVMDPNFVRDLHQQADGSKVRKSPSKHALSTENMDTITSENEMVTSNADVPVAGNTTEEKHDAEDDTPAIPPPPSQPWSCLHCTFVNPPGIHICQVCCKTSYRIRSSAPSDNQGEASALDNRNSESPMELVNLDAISNSPDFSGHKEAQKAEDSIGEDSLENEETIKQTRPGSSIETTESIMKLCTETQTFTTTKSTDVQTQNLICKSMASSTDSIFPKQEMSIQTETEEIPKHCSVATDPMISSQSMESLLSGMSAPPYHNRRAGWGRGTSFSTQSLFERVRSRSPIPRSLSMYNEAHSFGRDSSLPPEEAMHSWSQAWLMSDPMYYKPHNLPGLGQTLVKEDYFDGTWGSMDKLNRRVKSKQGEKFKSQQRPKFHRSLDDLKAEKTQDVIHSQELQFLQTVKEAERCGFSLEDLHVAYLHCGRENPVFWLEDNWSSMIKNVIALAAKYGEDNEENDVGTITVSEAKEALHIHRGDIWDAVTECIENRQRKILELTVRGNFTQKQISEALKNNDGNVELAYADLLRACSRRHKFILSPGLSEDSEDLALYNPTDDSGVDHAVGASALKAAKLDVHADTKTDKKKSDFLTKLSAIRQAQSERRKAREEKEMIRETTTQELPTTVEAEITSSQVEQVIEADVLKEEDIPQPELNAEALQENIEKDLTEAELELETPLKNKLEKKESIDDNIPVDYDTNWVESQGEWIEEYSDEQWDEESDGQWIALQKNYQKMEKEFEEEARQMAALWEKEELEDDVFEEEPNEALPSVQQTEAERLKAEQDEKFQQWVKVNLEKSASEPEDNEIVEPVPNAGLLVENSLSKSVEFDSNIICESPLQHYPTAFDLSRKSDPDWVQLEVGGENQAPVDFVHHEEEEILHHELEDQDILQELDERTTVSSHIANISDDEWEKIDEKELLELKHEEELMISSGADFPKHLDIEESLSRSILDENDIQETEAFKEPATVFPDESNVLPESSTTVRMENKREELKEVSPSSTIPKPPLRRRSKLSTTDIEEVLRNQPQSDFDVPPALPLKKKDLSPDKSAVSDIYAIPEKKHKEKASSVDSSAPLKPPRLNLSPTSETEKQGLTESEATDKKLLNVEFSKEASPATSLSNESDSNCFADSESDPEIKIIRQKYMHRKPAKYENEEDDLFEESFPKQEDVEATKSLRHAVEEAQGFDISPELPIPSSRSSRIADDMASPKAFREGLGRPLQLFKVTKNEPSSTAIEAEVKVVEKDIDISSVVKTPDEHVPKKMEYIEKEYFPETAELSVTSGPLPDKIETVDLDSEVPINPVQSSDSHYYNITTVESIEEIKRNEEAIRIQQEKAEIQPQPTNTVSDHVENIISEELPQASFQRQPESIKEEEEMTLAETEDGMFAAAEYFFGRYDEVVVTKPKKKSAVRSNKLGTPSAVPKVMSTSEIKVSADLKSPSVMEKSASPIMMSTSTAAVTEMPLQQPLKVQSPSTNSEAKPPSVSQNNSQIKPLPVETSLQTKSSTPEAPSSEYISYFEDYFFGSYNEVVVPKKVKKKVVPASSKKVTEKPKSSDAALSSDKMVSSMSPLETGKNQINLSMTTSLPDALHSQPSNLPFDSNERNEQTSMTTDQSEQYFDAYENDKRIDLKMKNVHFEDAQVIVPPPRKKRSKVESNRSSVSSYASFEEQNYLEQYDETSQSDVLDKKKLPPYSEDFKIIQGCDPSNLPSNSFFPTTEQQDSAVSSEISLYTPNESLNMIKEAEKTEKMENIVSEGVEISSINEVNEFSNTEKFALVSSGERPFSADIESEYQLEGELFKSQIYSQESQNSEFSQIDKDRILPESSQMCGAASIAHQDSSSLPLSDSECDQKFYTNKSSNDFNQSLMPKSSEVINEQNVEEISETQEIASTVSEDTTTFNTSESTVELSESKNIPDVQWQVPKLSTIIKKQASEYEQEGLEIGRIEEIDSFGSEFTCKKQELSKSFENTFGDNLAVEKNVEVDQKVHKTEECLSDVQPSLSGEIDSVVHSKNYESYVSSEDTMFAVSAEQCGQNLVTESASSDLEETSKQGITEEWTDNTLISESSAEKIDDDPSFLSRRIEYDDEDYEMQYREDSKLDDYSVLQMDEDFEDGLRLVEETEKLINEFCDIYPSGCFDVSSNEIQNLNTKNNKQDSTYDSEYEWKLNEERYNTLNANFVENKAYKVDIDPIQGSSQSKGELIIDTEITADEDSKMSQSAQEIRKSTSSLADISEISELVIESHDISEQNVEKVLEGAVSYTVQPLSVLCQTATSVLECSTSVESMSFDLSEVDYPVKEKDSEIGHSVKDTSDVLNEGSDDSLASSHSSVSTQIAVLADTVLQDLSEELGISLESKTNVTDEYEKIPTSSTDEIEAAADSKTDEVEKVSIPGTEIESSVTNTTSNQSLEMKSIIESKGIEVEQSTVIIEKEIKSEICDALIVQSNETEQSIEEIKKEIKKGDEDVCDTESKEVIIDKLTEQTEKEITYDVDKSNTADSNQTELSVNNSETIVSINNAYVAESDKIKQTDESVEIKMEDIFNSGQDLDISCTETTKVEVFEVLEKGTVIEPSESSDEVNVVGADIKISEPECTDPEKSDEYLDESSLMSHFYDEWIENVKMYETNSGFQQDLRNLYITNDNSESASSGNVSENEEFTFSFKGQALESLPTYSSELPNEYEQPVLDTTENINVEWSEEVVTISDVNDVARFEETRIDEISDAENSLVYHSEEPIQSAEQAKDTENVINENLCETIKLTAGISNLEEIVKEAQIDSIESFAEKIYSTSKSCQTDDSFEEDQFFDSFDDPTVDPSFMFLPVFKSTLTEPIKTEIGVQCCLISDETVISDTSFDSSDHDVNQNENKTKKEKSVQDIKETLVQDAEPVLVSSDAVDNIVILPGGSRKTREDSSSESTEDTDSDLFLEPYSSHDEFETDSKSKSHFLYAEIDSDTGFSSGSDSGRRSSKQKFYSKDSKVLSSEKEESVQDTSKLSSEISKEENGNLSFESEDNISLKTDTSTTHKEIKESVSHEKETTPVSTDKSKTSVVEIKTSDATEKLDLPPEILERAVTPISIKKVPSVESDLTFVDIESELSDQVVERRVSDGSVKPPTVEYFYGPLPQTVHHEISQDNNESFVEALELLDACATEVEKDILESSISTKLLDSKFNLPTEIGEAEDFSESLASFHEPDDDLTESISEYFPLPDSEEIILESKSKSQEADIDTKLQEPSISIKKTIPKTDLGNEPSSDQKTVEDLPKSSSDFPSCVESDEKETETKMEQISQVSTIEGIESAIIKSKTELISSDTQSKNVVPASFPDDISLPENIESFTDSDNISTVSEIEESIYSEAITDYLSPTNESEDTSKNYVPLLSEGDTQKTLNNIEPEKESVLSSIDSDIHEENKPSSKELSETKLDTDSLYKESIPEYFSSEPIAVNNEPRENVLKQIEHSEETVTTKMDFESITENIEGEIPDTLDQSDSQEIEVSVYEEISNDNIEALDEMQSLKRTGVQSDIPPVPSDIVRYLYYDDSIKFEDDASIYDESSNSLYSLQSSTAPEPVNVPSDVSAENLDSDVKESIEEVKLTKISQDISKALKEDFLKIEEDSHSKENIVSEVTLPPSFESDMPNDNIPETESKIEDTQDKPSILQA
ncbi:e3 ubiquitin-protein ligase RNF31, partial [Trichonephila inaurata madagascariensis]